MEHLGLVGLPDSGHAQLFSALTGIDTPTGFETTKGVASLPDDRVDRLAEMSKSKKRIHATFEIDFIPGLAPGGKAGEGLGSRLLGSLRDTDGVLAVVRAGYDADPPELRAVSIPGSAKVGDTVQFSASSFDVWPVGEPSFDFGDGGQAEGGSVSHVYSAPGSYTVRATATDAVVRAGIAPLYSAACSW